MVRCGGGGVAPRPGIGGDAGQGVGLAIGFGFPASCAKANADRPPIKAAVRKPLVSFVIVAFIKFGLVDVCDQFLFLCNRIQEIYLILIRRIQYLFRRCISRISFDFLL
jgi:hypothetical protein